jgi:hypothetical protein
MSVDFGAVKRPARERLLLLLNDLAWHEYSELQHAAGVRYGARVLELKRLGYQIRTEGKKENGLRYRLVSNVPGAAQGKRVKVLLREADAELLYAFAVEKEMIPAVIALAEALGTFKENRGKL